MSAEIRAEIRAKNASKQYEQETGIPVSPGTVLAEQFDCLRKIFLIHETLGEIRLARESEG